MCNEVETCVRNLKSLKVETATYGCLLIPILKEKLPDSLLMIISRKFGASIWTLEEFLMYLNEELKAKESCLTFSKGSSSNENQVRMSTAEVFHVQVNNSKHGPFINKCVYCLKQHPPSQCVR